MNENGVLSFRGSFFNSFPRNFDSFFHFTPLIAPLWTDLFLGPGSIVAYQMTSDDEFLEMAENLVQQQFPGADFEPESVIVVTWADVGHTVSRSL